MNSRTPFLSMDSEKTVTSDPLVKIKLLINDYKAKEIELEPFKKKAVTLITDAIKQGADYYGLKQTLGEHEFGLINLVVTSDEKNEKYLKIKLQMLEKQTEIKLDPKRVEINTLASKLKLFFSSSNLQMIMTDEAQKKNEAQLITKLNEYQTNRGNPSELIDVPIGTLLRFFKIEEDKKAKIEQQVPLVDPKAAALFDDMTSLIQTTVNKVAL